MRISTAIFLGTWTLIVYATGSALGRRSALSQPVPAPPLPVANVIPEASYFYPDSAQFDLSVKFTLWPDARLRCQGVARWYNHGAEPVKSYDCRWNNYTVASK